MKKSISFLCFGLLLLFSAPFLSAFTTFHISPESNDFNLSTLQSSSTVLTVSFSSPTFSEEENQPYKIDRTRVCNSYDEDYDCTDFSLNLCPYISISNSSGEGDDMGYALDASHPHVLATGELNPTGDLSDDWTLGVTSPCFEGECPVGYNSSINGDPLPQSLKGQIFECDMSVDWNGGIFQVRDFSKTALASITNTMRVRAMLTGSTDKVINPVIIIPGIMGSAYKNDELVIDPILHTYDDLIATLVANGYREGVDLFTFPYEWRDSNVFSANLLKGKIIEVRQACLVASLPDLDCSKVDLVAHSMGGLVARSYIQSVADYDHDVDQLIFLGTPHKGSPTDYLQWEAGQFPSDVDNALNSLFFEAEALRNGYLRVFDYIHGRPILSVKELLPVFDYLEDDDTGVLRQYPIGYPQNNFLESLNSNISNLLNSGVEITNIVGNSGSDTIERIRVVPSSQFGLWEHGEPDGFRSLFGDHGLENGIGDGTVTIFGASLDNSISNKISSNSHRRIPTVEAGKVFNILTSKTATTTFDHGFQLSPKVLLIQLLSPIDLVVTAPDSKKVGKNFGSGGEFAQIPGAFYSGFETDAEYITILNPIDGEYKIELQGTDSGGEYGVLTSFVSDTFSITTETVGITELGQVTKLEVAIDADSPSGLEVGREVTLEVFVSDIEGAYDLGWITDNKVRESLIKQAKLIIKFEKKRNGKLETKVDKILIRLLEKELDFLKKKGKINIEAYNIIKADLEWLILNN